MSKSRAIIVVDLGFGDAGKGTLVDYFVRRHASDLVVRFNGGPQAAHNVVLPDGRHHTFAQFGSGTFVPGVRTLLSRFMLIEPYAMLNEARHLAEVGVADAFDRLLIDERCRVITPAHTVANRIRERSRGAEAHGTCGMGVGECVADSLARPDGVLRAGELRDDRTVIKKCRAAIAAMHQSLGTAIDFATPEERRVLEDDAWVGAAVKAYDDIARRASIVGSHEVNRVLGESTSPICEGAQGVLLDEAAGFAPHTTWSRTTRHNADELLHESGRGGGVTCIGVTRCYATRHGAGPFPSEDVTLDALLPEPHNGSAGPQGKFRRGLLDLVLLRYAIEACGAVDELAITHLDRLSLLPSGVASAYTNFSGRLDTESIRHAVPVLSPVDATSPAVFCDAVATSLGVPVRHRSWGPTHIEKSSPADDS